MSRHDTEDGSGGEDDDVALALGAIFTVSRESLSFPCPPYRQQLRVVVPSRPVRRSRAIGPSSSTNPRANDRGVRKHRETRRRRLPPPSPSSSESEFDSLSVAVEHDLRPARRQPPTLGPPPVRLPRRRPKIFHSPVFLTRKKQKRFFFLR